MTEKAMTTERGVNAYEWGVLSLIAEVIAMALHEPPLHSPSEQ